MRYTVTKQLIQVIGEIWMPATTCAMTYTLTDFDLDNLGDPTDRDDVEDWLVGHSGDLQSITDWRADFTIGGQSVVHEWASEESEFTFNDCMYSNSDDE